VVRLQKLLSRISNFRFQNDSRDLPTLWHQALLVFVQIYKNDLSTEQREALLMLIKKKSHFKITPEVRRELHAATCRDQEMGEKMMCDEELGDTSNMDF
jgi:essential nuclear protein 1